MKKNGMIAKKHPSRYLEILILDGGGLLLPALTVFLKSCRIYAAIKTIDTMQSRVANVVADHNDLLTQ